MAEPRHQSARRRLPDVMQGRKVFLEPFKYKLSQRIGEGSWAVCYAAKPMRGTGKTIAVKCIPRKGLNEKHRQAIKGELECHRVVSGRHKNILRMVCVHEDVDDDVLYLGTELCIGGNLRNYVDRNILRGQSPKIQDIFIQVLDGLKAMHDSHIYHRDLKPDNIFIKDERTVVIGDFGFATSRRKTADFGMGTPGYVAPEVIRGVDDSLKEWSSPHGDIWALGVILLDLVTGSEADLGWENAKLSDKAFHYYYFKKDRPFFSEIFDITKETDDVFRAIFETDIERRISLDELREKVRAIASFGEGTQKNAAMVYREARSFWRHANGSKRRIESANHNHDEFSDSSPTLCIRDDEAHHIEPAAVIPVSVQPSDDLPLLDQPETSVSVPVRPQRVRPVQTPAARASQRAQPVPQSSESESGEDSDGPETPQTIAADDQVAIQTVEDFALDLDAPNASDGKLLRKEITPAATTSLMKLLQKKRPVMTKMQTWIRGAFRPDAENKVEETLVQPMA